jgi:anti-sigma factor RsiW
MANLLAPAGVEMNTMRRLLSKVMRPNPRKCEEARALMSDYVDGALDPTGRKRVERHVRFCDRCHTVLGNLRQTLGGLRRLQKAALADGDDLDAVAGRVVRGWRDQV